MEEKEPLLKEEVPSVEQKTTEEAEIVKEDAQYKLYGYDVSTSNPEIKAFYQSTMSLLVQSNLLIGDFDDKGNYVITKEIKRDIVVMDKEIEDTGENFFKATSLYMKKNFYFYISISMLPENKAKAKLYLYEFVGDYFDKDFVISHIANYIDNFDENFTDKVKKAFNLVDVDVPNNDFDTPNLAIRMQRMLDEEVRAQDLYEMSCQIFTIRLLKCLENYEKGRKLVQEYKKLLEKHKGKLTFVKQKALLERLINKMCGYDEVLKNNPQAQALLAEFIKSYQEILKSRVEKDKQEVNSPTAENKKATAGKSASKPAGKKPAAKKPAAKKPAKKAGKKKDDKKKEKKKGGGVSESERAKFRAEAEKKFGLKTKEDSLEKKADLKTNQAKEEKQPKPKEQEKPKEQAVDDEFESLSEEVGVASMGVKTAQEFKLNSNRISGGTQSVEVVNVVAEHGQASDNADEVQSSNNFEGAQIDLIDKSQDNIELECES